VIAGVEFSVAEGDKATHDIVALGVQGAPKLCGFTVSCNSGRIILGQLISDAA
jgi:hypothetical protein